MILPAILMLQLASTPDAVAVQPDLTVADVALHSGKWAFDLYYPERAQRLGISGEAIARCRITAEGSLRDCAVLSFAPADQGFNEAALKLLESARADIATRKGEPSVGRTLDVTIQFKVRRSIYSVRLY